MASDIVGQVCNLSGPVKRSSRQVTNLSYGSWLNCYELSYCKWLRSQNEALFAPSQQTWYVSIDNLEYKGTSGHLLFRGVFARRTIACLHSMRSNKYGRFGKLKMLDNLDETISLAIPLIFALLSFVAIVTSGAAFLTCRRSSCWDIGEFPSIDLRRDGLVLKWPRLIGMRVPVPGQMSAATSVRSYYRQQ